MPVGGRADVLLDVQVSLGSLQGHGPGTGHFLFRGLGSSPYHRSALPLVLFRAKDLAPVAAVSGGRQKVTTLLISFPAGFLSFSRGIPPPLPYILFWEGRSSPQNLVAKNPLPIFDLRLEGF